MQFFVLVELSQCQLNVINHLVRKVNLAFNLYLFTPPVQNVFFQGFGKVYLADLLSITKGENTFWSVRRSALLYH